MTLSTRSCDVDVPGKPLESDKTYKSKIEECEQLQLLLNFYLIYHLSY